MYLEYKNVGAQGHITEDNHEKNGFNYVSFGIPPSVKKSGVTQ